MARNFRITSLRRNGALHLRLSGDFDGMSAMELIYALKEHIALAGTIFIETDGLSTLLPFGREVFQKNFSFSSRLSQKFVFVGNPGRQLAPSGTSCMQNRAM